MKNILQDRKGNANAIIAAIFVVIMGFGMLTIGNYLYFAIATSADAGTLTAVPAVAASGTITFAGNVTDGDTISVNSVTFEYDTNLTASEVTAGNVEVDISDVTPVVATANMTVALNNNATTAALVTAANPDSTTITLTADTPGSDGNDITLADTGTNIVAGSMTGGADAVTGQSSQNTLNNYVSVTLPLFGLALMILGFSVIILLLRRSFSEGR